MHLRFAFASLAFSVALAGCGLLLDTSPPDQGPDGGTGGCTTAADCNDGYDCTHDSCEAGGVCKNSPDSALCEPNQVCAAGVGCTKPCSFDTDCDYLDFGACAQGSCNLDTGSGFCVLEYDSSLCPSTDSVPCTVEQCGLDGQCATVPSVDLCDDGFSCTVDACGTSGGSQDANGCTHVPSDAVCTASDCRKAGVCDPTNLNAAESGCTYVLDDAACALSNPTTDCSLSLCTPNYGCQPVLAPELCSAGSTCYATGCAPIEGSCDPANNFCDDGNPCNGTETCDTNTYTCIAGTEGCPAPADSCFEAYCRPTETGGWECAERRMLVCPI